MASMLQRIRLAGKALMGIYTDELGEQALRLMGGLFPAATGAPPVRGVKQTLEAYSTMPWLRAVSDKVAQSVAAVEWKVYVAKRGTERATRNTGLQRAGYPMRSKAIKAQLEGEDVQEIQNHPLTTLIGDANPYMTGLDLLKLTQIHLDLVGETFWIKERSRQRLTQGMPIGLWPIPPNWILSTPTPSARDYRVSFKGWQGTIPDTEILWFSNPNPANPYDRGSGVAQALADDLETDQYAARFTRGFFLNSARPDFIAWPEEGTLHPPEIARLEHDWGAKHQGFWRAFRAHFMSRKVGIYQFSQADLRAMQMVELRASERDIIMQTFAGFPPELLGVLTQSNRATIDSAAYLFNLFTIIPRLEFLRATMQERLVPEFDDRLILDYVSPVAEDKEFQLKAASAAPYTLTKDQWLTLQGLPASEKGDGDMHMVPIGLTPMEDWGTPPPAPEPELPAPVPGAEGGNGKAWDLRKLETADLLRLRELAGKAKR